MKGFFPVLSLIILLQFCLIVSIKFFSWFLLCNEKVLQMLKILSSISKIKFLLFSLSGIPLNEIIGFLTFANSKINILLTLYLIFLSIMLEIFHLLIPERTFQWSDLFGNLAGVIVVIIVFNLFKKYENLKN